MLGNFHEKQQKTPEALHAMLVSGTLTEDDLRRIVNQMDKEKQVARIHPYAITELKDGRYKTWLPLPDGGRKDIRARTREALLDRILAHYDEDGEPAQNPHLDNKTLYDVYEEWLVYKTGITASRNTIRRHEQHYNRYLKDLDIMSMDIRDIDYLTMQAVCNGIVREHNMTSKEWVNLKTVVGGMFAYAEEKGYISDNPMRRVKITVKYRQVVKKPGNMRTYTTAEAREIMEYMHAREQETGDAVFTAVIVNFSLGLRIGELTAIQWGDIEGDALHVVREEIRDHETGRVSVEAHTKTHSDRYVHLTPDARHALRALRDRAGDIQPGNFVFARKGKRITARQVTYQLEAYAHRTGHEVKRSHAIRRTYASTLQSAGIPIDEIRRQLGHSDLQTTLDYLYNPLTDSETARAIDRALSKKDPFERY